MTLSIQGDYTNGTAADGSEITTEFNYIYSGVNTHVATSPIDHPNGSVTADKLASSAVTTIKINADAVNGAKIADDSIDSEHYVDGSIDTAHLSATCVTIAKCAAGVAGHHGFLTRIKLLPSNFIGSSNNSGPYDPGDTDTGKSFRCGSTVVATVLIPSGYRATDVMVYADANLAVSIYECEIDDGTTATDVTPATHEANTEIALSSVVTASATNYLSISVANGANNEIWGGYVTIEEAT